MPKMKTHSGAKKRFKTSGSGKLVRRKQGRNHILEKKSAKRKRRLALEGEISKADLLRKHGGKTGEELKAERK